MLPVDEIFELVVDSAFVGMRKPDPPIYELTVERLGDGITPAECLFVDDVLVNVETARELGMTAVHFRSQRAGDRRDRGRPRRLSQTVARAARRRYGSRVKRDAAVAAVFKPVRPPTTFEETVERLGTAIRTGCSRPGSQAAGRAPARRGAADLALDPAPGAHHPGPVRPPDLGPRAQRRHLRRRAAAALRDRSRNRSATTPGRCSTTASRSRSAR